jgi:hypothetical protein
VLADPECGDTKCATALCLLACSSCRRVCAVLAVVAVPSDPRGPASCLLLSLSLAAAYYRTFSRCSLLRAVALLSPCSPLACRRCLSCSPLACRCFALIFCRPCCPSPVDVLPLVGVSLVVVSASISYRCTIPLFFRLLMIKLLSSFCSVFAHSSAS